MAIFFDNDGFSDGEINRRLTRRLKDIIRRFDLIDTGDLYRSISVIASIDRFGVVKVKVSAMYYLKYFWTQPNYQIESYFIAGRGIDTIIADLFASWIDYRKKEMPNMFDFLDGLQFVQKRVEVILYEIDNTGKIVY